MSLENSEPGNSSGQLEYNPSGYSARSNYLHFSFSVLINELNTTKFTILPSSALLSLPNLGPNIFIKFSVTDVLQFEKELAVVALFHRDWFCRIWTFIRTTLPSPNHSIDHCLKRIITTESQYRPLSEPNYTLRIRVWTIVRTTLLSPYHNMDHCLNHIMLSESESSSKSNKG